VLTLIFSQNEAVEPPDNGHSDWVQAQQPSYWYACKKSGVNIGAEPREDQREDDVLNDLPCNEDNQ